MNIRTLIAAGMLVGTTTAAALPMHAAMAAQNPSPTMVAQAAPIRGDRASDRNLWSVRRRLEAMIDQLQRDRRDYGGHRVAALRDLQNARNEILQAEQYDRGNER
jgi:Spy/CpxP family protein refolding chaperone